MLLSRKFTLSYVDHLNQYFTNYSSKNFTPILLEENNLVNKSQTFSRILLEFLFRIINFYKNRVGNERTIPRDRKFSEIINFMQFLAKNANFWVEYHLNL